MKLRGTADGVPFEADVVLEEAKSIVRVGGHRRTVALPGDPDRREAPGPGPFFMAALDGRRRRAGAWRDGAAWRVSLDGRLHTVRFADRLDETAGGVAARRALPGGPLAVVAPLPGLVSAIDVRPGDRVRKDQRLLGLDAMKLENAIGSPRDGIVRSVHVKAGQAVEKGAPLVTLG